MASNVSRTRSGWNNLKALELEIVISGPYILRKSLSGILSGYGTVPLMVISFKNNPSLTIWSNFRSTIICCTLSKTVPSFYLAALNEQCHKSSLMQISEYYRMEWGLLSAGNLSYFSAAAVRPKLSLPQDAYKRFRLCLRMRVIKSIFFR